MSNLRNLSTNVNSETVDTLYRIISGFVNFFTSKEVVVAIFIFLVIAIIVGGIHLIVQSMPININISKAFVLRKQYENFDLQSPLSNPVVGGSLICRSKHREDILAEKHAVYTFLEIQSKESFYKSFLPDDIDEFVSININGKPAKHLAKSLSKSFKNLTGYIKTIEKDIGSNKVNWTNLAFILSNQRNRPLQALMTVIDHSKNLSELSKFVVIEGIAMDLNIKCKLAGAKENVFVWDNKTESIYFDSEKLNIIEDKDFRERMRVIGFDPSISKHFSANDFYTDIYEPIIIALKRLQQITRTVININTIPADDYDYEVFFKAIMDINNTETSCVSKLNSSFNVSDIFGTQIYLLTDVKK